jgi:hypothetical protein
MIETDYYREGRGAMLIRTASAAHATFRLNAAMQLVRREATARRHQATSWTVGAGGARAQCAICGQSAIITVLQNCLFVDSCLSSTCTPHASEQPVHALAA